MYKSPSSPARTSILSLVLLLTAFLTAASLLGCNSAPPSSPSNTSTSESSGVSNDNEATNSSADSNTESVGSSGNESKSTANNDIDGLYVGNWRVVAILHANENNEVYPVPAEEEKADINLEITHDGLLTVDGSIGDSGRMTSTYTISYDEDSQVYHALNYKGEDRGVLRATDGNEGQPASMTYIMSTQESTIPMYCIKQ